MQRWWVAWPMAIAAVISLLNVELVVIPILVAYGMQGLLLFICTAAAASAEVCYWYWFAGWLAKQSPFIPAVERTVSEFQGQGYLGLVRTYLDRGAVLIGQMWAWFGEHVQTQMKASSPLPRWLLSRALGLIRTSPKWMVYPMMIGLGLCPLGWVPGILICRKHYVRGAFTVLLVFNSIKTYGIGLGWTALLELVVE